AGPTPRRGVLKLLGGALLGGLFGAFGSQRVAAQTCSPACKSEQHCCTSGATPFCVADSKACCGDTACSSGQTCCGNATCCNSSNQKCCGTVCCGAAQTCCGSGCCRTGQICVDGRCTASTA